MFLNVRSVRSVPLRLEAVRFDAIDPVVPAEFWAGVLGREVTAEPGGALVPGSETQVGLRFVASSTRKSGTNPTHLHLTSTAADDQQRTVGTVLNLGGRHVDVGQRPEDTHVVMADPEGNEFCVMAPGDTYLAGTGFLGEVTCRGSRDVGLFWRAALGWPLVWDKNEETAVQSPLGGTKVSWGGEPADSKREEDRQGLDLAATALPAEVRRLIALGATLLVTGDGSVAMADPGGYEFHVRDQ